VTHTIGLRPDHPAVPAASSAAVPSTKLSDAELAGELRRADGLSQHYTLLPGRPTGRRWVHLPKLADAVGVRAALRRVESRYGGGQGLAASFLATWVAGLVAYPLVAGVFTERRLLRPPADALWLRLDRTGDFFDALAVERAEVSAPVDDSPAGLAALQGELMDTYADLLDPVLSAVEGAGRRGRRALWADAADRVAGWYLLIGQTTGEVGRAVSEADATLATARAPLPTCVEWIQAGDATFKRRAVCCLAYRSPRFRDQYCATCPLLPVEESVRRLTES
jgi:ferric iron reductase protein FhuF